jgi:CheY-like chemotaxis protein
MRKILIVEDDEKIRALLKRLLVKKFRMEVCEAGDGLQGLEVCKAEKPRMIFLDILMPNMNGVEFLRELRQTDKETLVVVMTGMGDKELVQQMALLGITDYIIKSEMVFRLQDRIAEIIYSHSAIFN